MTTVHYKLAYRNRSGQVRGSKQHDICFARLEGYNGKEVYSGETAIDGVNNIADSITYYPNIRCTEEEAKEFLALVRSALSELPWPEGEMHEWADKGMTCSADYSGISIVSAFTVARYVDEECGTLRTMLKLGRFLEPAEAFYLAHYLTHALDTGYWINRTVVRNSNHTLLDTSDFSKVAFNYFTKKKYLNKLKAKEPYKSVMKYRGCHTLFGGVNYDAPDESFSYNDVVARGDDALLQLVLKWRKHRDKRKD